jgi:ELWxxDGT repeat protein
LKHHQITTLCATLLALFLPAWAAGQPASLLLDINSTRLDIDHPPLVNSFELQAAGNRLFFLADAGGAGTELWTSDGTSAGTEILRDLCPGSCNVSPGLYGALGKVMLFAIQGDNGQVQLWRSDGTRPGTFALTGPGVNIFTLTAQDVPHSAFFHGALYFSGCPVPTVPDQACDLWKSDGTVAGTQLVHHSPHVVDWMFVVGDRLYFLKSGSSGSELWRTDGTAHGTVQLRQFSDGPNQAPQAVATAGGRLFFLARDAGNEEVWTSDGTAAGTRQLTSFPGDNPFGSATWLKPEGNRVYFLADDGAHGMEIWRSDGTATGTARVTDLVNDAPFINFGPDVLTEVGGVVLFRAFDPRSPAPLWTSTGTPESTAPFAYCSSCQLDPYTGLIEAAGKAFFLTSSISSAQQLAVTDGTAAGSRAFNLCSGCSVDTFQPWQGGVLFLTGRSPEDKQIWFSDGTAAGTKPYTNLPLGVTNFRLEVVGIGANLYFLITDGAPGLWERDAAGKTRQVSAFPIPQPSSEPGHLTPLGNRLVFNAWDGISLPGLWTSAGTPETTAPVSVPGVDWNDATDLVPAAGLLFFQVRPSVNDHQLWRTDGTAAGTFLLAQLTDQAVLVPYQGKLYYFVDGQIWRSDGTAQGTVKTGDFPASLISVDEAAPGPNGIYLKTVTDPYHSDFWFTDGTSAGTRQLTHLNVNGVAGWPPHFTVFGGNVYFTWIDGHLWKTNGTAAGTVPLGSFPTGDLVTQIAPLGGALYFFTSGFSGESSVRLWRTDGTDAGTVQVREFAFEDVFGLPLQLVPFAGKLYFNVDDGVHGTELWSSDGTAAGTALVRDIYPGRRGSQPTHLTVAGGRLFFVAGDDVHGVELWQSDGTAAGTRLVQDIAPQAFSSNPDQLTVAGDKLYFTADDGVRGREVWVLPLAGSAACQPTSTRLCLSGGRYAVEATWEDFQGHRGVGHAVALTPDTGYFWFFSESNVEAVLKVLDGTTLNDHVWVFYGALSNVEYTLTVTDSQTGLTHRYVNPSGTLASVADTDAFGPLGAFETSVTSVATPSPVALVSQRVVPAAAKAACAPSSTRLCLNGNRYAVEIAWKDFSGHTGAGQAVPLSGDTGWFWFFSSTNVEVILKVLDGTAVNGHHWVFYGALSNVEYTVTVTDTQTGKVDTYKNLSGQLASVADTGAF